MKFSRPRCIGFALAALAGALVLLVADSCLYSERDCEAAWSGVWFGLALGVGSVLLGAVSGGAGRRR